MNRSKRLHLYSTYCPITRTLSELAYAQPSAEHGQYNLVHIDARAYLSQGYIFFVFYPELNIKHVQDYVPTVETPMGNTKKGTTLKDIARDRFLPDGGLPPLLQETER